MLAHILPFRIWLIVFVIVGLSVPIVDHVSTATAAPKFRTGFVPESDAVYRTFKPVPRHRAYLPPAVDLSSRFPTPGFQGEQGSCTAWALAYAVLSYHRGQEHDWQYTSSERLFSPAYLYNQLVQDKPACDKGIRVSETLRLLRDEGVATMALFPYDAKSCSRLPTATVRAAGRKHRILDWQVIAPGNLDDIKGQLSKGHPVVFGIDVPDSFMDWRGDLVYADLTEPRPLLHAMVFVGYDEQRQAFRAMNSWGTAWGDKGFVWIHYDVVRKFVKQMYVIDVGVPPKAPPASDPVVASPDPSPSPPVQERPAPPLPIVQPPRQDIPPPVPPPSTIVSTEPGLSRTEIATRVNDHIRRMECSKINATPVANHTVHLRGFAGSPTQLHELKEHITRLPGVSTVQDDVSIRPWPQCEAYLTFDAMLATPRGLTVQVRGAPRLNAGDLLVVDLTSPDFPSYVYVSYLQASGEAVHLAWPVGKSPGLVPPNAKLVFGDPDTKGPRFRIQAPFGDEILIAFASSTPLFTGNPSSMTGDRAYLTAFRQLFLTKRTAESTPRTVVGAVLPLVTKATD